MVEFTFNKLTLEFNHWYVVIAYSLCYYTEIVVWTKTGGYSIYWFAGFDTVDSWALTTVFLFLFNLTFFVFYWLQNLKTYSATRSNMILLSFTDSAAQTGKGVMTQMILQV